MSSEPPVPEERIRLRRTALGDAGEAEASTAQPRRGHALMLSAPESDLTCDRGEGLRSGSFRLRGKGSLSAVATADFNRFGMPADAARVASLVQTYCLQRTPSQFPCLFGMVLPPCRRSLILFLVRRPIFCVLRVYCLEVPGSYKTAVTGI